MSSCFIHGVYMTPYEDEGATNLAEAFLVLAEVDRPAARQTGLLQRQSTVAVFTVVVLLLHLPHHVLSVRSVQIVDLYSRLQML